MYTVIGALRSRTLRVLWMLEELGQPYDHHPAGPRSDRVKSLNPSGKIPVLIDQGTVLTDSTAIIQFLADKHGALTFPAGSHDRARQDGLTQMVLDEIEGPLWMHGRHSYILPENMRIEAVKPSLKWEFEQNQTRLAELLGDAPFLMGEMMTVPDIIATHCIRWAIKSEFPPPSPLLRDYLARMTDRPAFKRAVKG